MRIQIVDRDGVPVANIPVNTEWGASGVVTAVTDGNGMISTSGTAYIGEVLVTVFDVPGMYYHHTDLPFREYQLASNGNPARWLPWDALYTVSVKRIKQPVPMYAKNVLVPIPRQDTPLGFDLERGDWVEPYGCGRISDFVFQFHKEGDRMENLAAELTLGFSGSQDGLIHVPKPKRTSELASEYQAPADGYAPKWTGWFGPAAGKKAWVPDQNGYFRIRTQTDDAGRLTNAWYGKLYDNFRVTALITSEPHLKFTYYVNPSGERNVEFDLTRNLLRGLSDDEGNLSP